MSMFLDYSKEPELDHRGGLGHVSKFHVVEKPVTKASPSRSTHNTNYVSTTPKRKFNGGTVMAGVHDENYDYESDVPDEDNSSSDEGTAEDWAAWSENVTTPGWLEEDMAEGP